MSGINIPHPFPLTLDEVRLLAFIGGDPRITGTLELIQAVSELGEMIHSCAVQEEETKILLGLIEDQGEYEAAFQLSWCLAELEKGRKVVAQVVYEAACEAATRNDPEVAELFSPEDLECLRRFTE